MPDDRNSERVIEARAILVRRAKWAARVIALSPYEFEANVRREIPEYVALMGDEELKHLIAFFWGL